VSLGLQAVLPEANSDALMVFLGFDGTVHFIDGDLPIGEQPQLGYNLLGGFAVKVFEVGVRYSSFSDVKNIGVHLGLRLQGFNM
jgi:hypothetical protein